MKKWDLPADKYNSCSCCWHDIYLHGFLPVCGQQWSLRRQSLITFFQKNGAPRRPTKSAKHQIGLVKTSGRSPNKGLWSVMGQLVYYKYIFHISQLTLSKWNGPCRVTDSWEQWLSCKKNFPKLCGSCTWTSWLALLGAKLDLRS